MIVIGIVVDNWKYLWFALYTHALFHEIYIIHLLIRDFNPNIYVHFDF
jgi:hypothetical protein